jgi:fructose-1-phosphate kinase PfkB-like protein
VIKPNRQEASALVDKDIRTFEDATAAANQLRHRGVDVAILSLGDQGAVIATHNAMLLGFPPAVRAKSTVGSGDCFLAGWALTEAQGKEPRDCLRSAIACGTANCLADSPGRIELSTVNELMSAVRIEDRSDIIASDDAARREEESE